MRSETQLEGKEILCVCIKEASKYFKVTPAVFSQAVRRSGMGKTQEKRDFLCVTATDNCIKKNNCCRQSSVAVFLHKLPQNLKSRLKQCMLHY